jgi:TonB family protein
MLYRWTPREIKMRRIIAVGLLLAAAPCRAQGGGQDSVYDPRRLSDVPAVVAVPPFQYPASLGSRSPHGRAVVRVVVDTFGRVEPGSITVIETPDSALAPAVLDFAAHVLFRPGRVRGHRVRVVVDLPIVVEPPSVPMPPPASLDEVQVKPELRSVERPRYPPEQARSGLEGVVEVEGVLDTLGRLEDSTLRVRASPGPEFSAEALRSLRTARYRPARLNGRAVRVLIRQPVNFEIPEGRCRHRNPVPQPLPQIADLGPLPDGVRVVSTVDTQPVMVSHPGVRYPLREGERGEEATVLVAVIVDTAGRAEASFVHALGDADSAFAREAVRVVRAARFSPGWWGGARVPTVMVVPVTFAIHCR